MNAPVRSGRLLLALALQARAEEAHAAAHASGWTTRRARHAALALDAFTRACSRLSGDEARALFTNTKGLPL